MDEKPLVLLVDDDVNTRHGYVELLERRGFRVIAAADVDRALAIVHDDRPDVVVTDIALPGRNGFEFAAALRSQPGANDVQILAMTAYWATDVHERAGRAGISAVLAKPCQPEHLLAEVRRAVAFKRRDTTGTP